MPERIQRRRARGWRMPDSAVYIGRPSKWANPFIVGRHYMWEQSNGLAYPVAPTNLAEGIHDNGVRVECCTLQTAITWHAVWLEGQDLSELAGRDLACWCPTSAPCHGDNLLAAANGKATP